MTAQPMDVINRTGRSAPSLREIRFTDFAGQTSSPDRLPVVDSSRSPEIPPRRGRSGTIPPRRCGRGISSFRRCPRLLHRDHGSSVSAPAESRTAGTGPATSTVSTMRRRVVMAKYYTHRATAICIHLLATADLRLLVQFEQHVVGDGLECFRAEIALPGHLGKVAALPDRIRDVFDECIDVVAV